MSRHIIWIDNAKLLAMFLVLFEHHGLENRFVADWIWTFHLAAFIFISGLFANSKSNFGVFLKNNFNRLIIPVVLWHLIGSISWQPALAYVMKPSEVLHSLLQTQMDFFAGRSCGFGWFMICLFWIKCEFWFLHRLNISLLYICGLLLFPLAAFILNVNEIVIPFYIVNSLMSFPFYLFGYALRDRVKTLQLSPLLAWPFFFILVAISLLLCLQFGRYSLNSLEFGYPPAVIYLQGLLGAFFVLLFSYIIQFEKPVFKILGGGTIVLLLLQPPFLLISKVLYRIVARPQHPAPYFDIFSAILFSIIIMLLMVPIIKVIDKYVPMLNGHFKNK